MFANFDNTDFPYIKVKMSGVPENDNDFQNFLNQWLELYNNQKDFTFIFDTLDVGLPHIKYSIKMSQFIKNLKKKEYQYLQKSIILINSNKIKHMLDFIFLLQPPVAPVYIHNYDSHSIDNLDILCENIINNDSTTCIEPGKSIIPFL
tara:strand:+ start:294 stop:737 length:444 start_codon:yes stop_codon:yes gene_type:complete